MTSPTVPHNGLVLRADGTMEFFRAGRTLCVSSLVWLVTPMELSHEYDNMSKHWC